MIKEAPQLGPSPRRFRSSYPVLGRQLPPLLHLLRQQLPDALHGAVGAELLLKVPPGLQQHQPLLLLLAAPHAPVGLLVGLAAPLQPVRTVHRQLELGVTDPDLRGKRGGQSGPRSGTDPAP